MLGAGLFAFGFLAGVFAVALRLFGGIGYRPLLTLVETCLLLGSVFFATGLLSEQIAQQRAEVRELRREIETMDGRRQSRRDAGSHNGSFESDDS